MIFADKLIQLRKKSGWSQEELADQMDVTRQSVSKWEGAQSVPDLEKMLRLSKLFGVSTDYLLNDELESPEYSEYPGNAEETHAVKRVSMEEAHAFISVKAVTAKSIASATFLCIISPVCLLILGGAAETGMYGLSENMAYGIGMIIMLILVTIAVAIFISSGSKTTHFEYLEKEIFETGYGVSGMVNERKEQYKGTYTKCNIIGTCMCILSLIPLFIGSFMNEDSYLLIAVTVALMFIFVGIGVLFFIRGGVVWASFEKLLQEGDYSKQKKENRSVVASVSAAYWLVATAIYLAYSFATDNWHNSWIVWPVAGVLYPAVIAIVNAFGRKK